MREILYIKAIIAAFFLSTTYASTVQTLEAPLIPIMGDQKTISLEELGNLVEKKSNTAEIEPEKYVNPLLTFTDDNFKKKSQEDDQTEETNEEIDLTVDDETLNMLTFGAHGAPKKEVPASAKAEIAATAGIAATVGVATAAVATTSCLSDCFDSMKKAIKENIYGEEAQDNYESCLENIINMFFKCFGCEDKFEGECCGFECSCGDGECDCLFCSNCEEWTECLKNSCGPDAWLDCGADLIQCFTCSNADEGCCSGCGSGDCCSGDCCDCKD